MANYPIWHIFKEFSVFWYLNSDLQTGIWFGSKAPSPIITCMMHDAWRWCMMRSESSNYKLGRLDKVLVLKFVLTQTDRQTDQPRYRVQDGLWPNHKNTSLAAPTNAINIHQGSFGAVRSSLATSCDKLAKSGDNTNFKWQDTKKQQRSWHYDRSCASCSPGEITHLGRLFLRFLDKLII